MSKDRLDTDFPKISLDNEDRANFQRARVNQASTGQTNSDTKSKGGGVGGFWVLLVFLIAAAACGASYWLYEQKSSKTKYCKLLRNALPILNCVYLPPTKKWGSQQLLWG